MERRARTPLVHLVRAGAVIAGAGMLSACDERADQGDSPDSLVDRAANDESTQVSHWRPIGAEEFLIDIADDAIAAELEAASQQARDAAESARLDWLDSVLTDRKHNWMINWAAPVPGGQDLEGGSRVEHVWIRPIEWSPFRIEGVLLSAPRADIGAAQGDLVSFPVEQLSDWVHVIEMNGAAGREGGYTLEVLERHFGAPTVE
jgi:uncharacterized protein YegJ (DUF2314 family)